MILPSDRRSVHKSTKMLENRNNLPQYSNYAELSTEFQDQSPRRNRPGVKPAIPDEQLSRDELEKRKKRRERNAIAARNCRLKKEKTLNDLKGE